MGATLLSSWQFLPASLAGMILDVILLLTGGNCKSEIAALRTRRQFYRGWEPDLIDKGKFEWEGVRTASKPPCESAEPVELTHASPFQLASGWSPRILRARCWPAGTQRSCPSRSRPRPLASRSRCPR